MADISICRDHDCPSRVHCYRYRAKPHEFRQGYINFKHDGERCEFYQSTSGWDDRALLPMDTLNWMAKAEEKGCGMREINKCNLCGKFKPWTELVCGLQAEGDESWNECKDCMSDADFKQYFPGESREEKGDGT